MSLGCPDRDCARPRTRQLTSTANSRAGAVVTSRVPYGDGPRAGALEGGLGRLCAAAIAAPWLRLERPGRAASRAALSTAPRPSTSWPNATSTRMNRIITGARMTTSIVDSPRSPPRRPAQRRPLITHPRPVRTAPPAPANRVHVHVQRRGRRRAPGRGSPRPRCSRLVRAFHIGVQDQFGAELLMYCPRTPAASPRQPPGSSSASAAPCGRRPGPPPGPRGPRRSTARTAPSRRS